MRHLLARCRLSVVQPRTDDKEAPMNRYPERIRSLKHNMKQELSHG